MECNDNYIFHVYKLDIICSYIMCNVMLKCNNYLKGNIFILVIILVLLYNLIMIVNYFK